MSRARDTADGIARAVTDGIIVDADINASAAIAQSKVADLSTTLSGKVDYAMATNTQSGTGSSAYTFVLADANRLTASTGATAKTFTIPPQSSVVWVNNSIIRVVNYGAGTLTIAGGVGVTVTNATKTLAQYESAALIRTGSDAWTLVPFSGGVSNADFSNTATGTYTSGLDNYKYVAVTSGTGTITITKSGVADILVVGAGGNGSGSLYGGSGAGGGAVVQVKAMLEAGTYTCVIGNPSGSVCASGERTTFSGPSFTDPIIAGGGGGGNIGGTGGNVGSIGACGAGSAPGTGGGTASGALGVQGGNGFGATGWANKAGGGGAGGNATSINGGPGVFSSITGTSVEYGKGGTGGSSGAYNEPPNTGKGGNGGLGPDHGQSYMMRGSSGVVIVRVKV